ncbi:hypothetical protein COA17_08330 [Sphingomonas ginsenosidimutans]|uniref:Rad50/SbcC-type AAA domain-containing protein n=1 Tax=Sphingomonas ginsenosidimutans TaxID=862134 RepID=A0A2A4HZP5_9SPHN|nr:ATP-binding protein [Sphingomonas ginsenosidimutans]PCG09834.1 hypothetical protein COA17_08330 [Sphingomonas ginsenosidimutans]
MRIVSLELDNFRRFRRPLRLDGFEPGLNVVVEPNETGKSTLLEALRAALFIRHSARTELTRSYCPIGDDVAPRVAVDFEVAGERWQVEKQFLRSQKVQLTGPHGRFESDAAEDQLQALLGFERGNNRGTDPDTRGALGLLWVEQASALRVDAPNRLVRDNVRTALESEVGAITGGRRFEVVRARVEEAYAELRTGSRGRSTGRLAAAETRLTTAREHRASVEALAQAHETTLTELEDARAARRRIERELGDEEQVALRDRLAADLKLAESSAERLVTAQARYDTANGTVERLTEKIAAIDAAQSAVEKAEAANTAANAAVEQHGDERDEAIRSEEDARTALSRAREARNTAEAALRTARATVARRERSEALARARERLTSLDALEAELARQQRVADQVIASEQLEELAKLDKTVVEARAIVSAGAVRVEVTSLDGTPVTMDGEPMSDAAREVTAATMIEVGRHATIRVLPPGTGSAAAEMKAAEGALASAEARLGVASYADAVARANDARSAGEAVKGLKRQVDNLCVADPTIGLAAGGAALRALLAKEADETAEEDTPVDVPGLEAAQILRSEEERSALGRHNVAVEQLRTAEETSRRLGLEAAGAARDLANARTQLAALTGARSRADLEANLVAAEAEVAERLRDRVAAEQAVGAFDLDRLRLRLANIDKAAAGAGDRRLALIEKIAGLEATIASEGAKGLAGQVDAAREEEVAAEQAVVRLTAEADALALLRTTLNEAQEAVARTFLGPVTKRTVQYVRRVLPDCDVTFSEELGLTSIARSGVSEGCGDLSRGTQEQLAVLTRLAFADLLLEKGEPVSLILDDPLVYSDDARLEVMTDILTRAAERMQVILLTCRERAFRHMGGHRITIG